MPSNKPFMPVLPLLLFLVALLAAAPAAAAPLSDADQQCLGCHGQPGLTKTFGAETHPVNVNAEAFAASVHAPVGCAACHAGIDAKTHPGTPGKYESRRAFSVAASQACQACHGPIFEAQAASVHGKARGKQKEGGIQAPVCSDCHRPHQVTPRGLTAANDVCMGCHGGVPARHEQWLPNTKRHLESVSCAACHAPTAKKQVDLRIYEAAGRNEIAGKEATVQLAAKQAAAGPLDEPQLAEIVKSAGGSEATLMVGRVEVSSAEEAHALGAGAKATKDCTACHRNGAEPFRKVTLSLVGADGKRVRHPAQQKVLSAPGSVGTVQGFYAMGGTRITALDVLVALALGAGILAPLGHLALRRILRRKGKGNA